MRHWLAFGFIAFCALFPLLVLAAYVASPGWTWPELVPGRFDTHAVEYLLSQYPVITRHMLSSVAYSLATVVVTFCLSIFPAHHFARHDFAGKTFLEGLLLAPALVPSMTFSMGVHVMFIRTGWQIPLWAWCWRCRFSAILSCCARWWRAIRPWGRSMNSAPQTLARLGSCGL
ncbi:hypothetical protein [Salidesulfovibrio brasiliensis]|uniref:hypothetical protein n=1 Tax=Salidesulfovibrio brasiliensis TaxID=221711 RepID=UPI000A91676A|nr:hypothetical protein [Salidesulfovibrio brasiliensis]